MVAASKALKTKLSLFLVVSAAAFFGWYAVQQARTSRLQARIVEQAKSQAYAMRLEELPTNSILFGIQLIGSDTFRLHVARSLLLLRLADFNSFRRVTNAIGIVREDPRSCVWVTNVPPIVDMSTKWSLRSLTWCAGGLAHEARHVELHRIRPKPPPFIVKNSGSKPAYPKRGYKDFQRDELACFAFQAKVLKNLRAPRSELNSVLSSDGTHFDVNRDGKYDWDDYRLHDW